MYVVIEQSAKVLDIVSRIPDLAIKPSRIIAEIIDGIKCDDQWITVEVKNPRRRIIIARDKPWCRNWLSRHTQRYSTQLREIYLAAAILYLRHAAKIYVTSRRNLHVNKASLPLLVTWEYSGVFFLFPSSARALFIPDRTNINLNYHMSQRER